MFLAHIRSNGSKGKLFMIIIINGPRNAGKTTISNLLAKKLAKTAHIEIDTFREFLRSESLEKTIPTNLENAVLVAQNLVQKGWNVILNYCLREKDYQYLLHNLKSLNTTLYTITLKSELKIALSNRGRKLTSDDRKRIREQYGKGKHAIPEYGLVVNNANKSPAFVVKEILKYMRVN